MINQNVPLYNPAMPEDLKQEALKKNSEALQSQAISRAVNLLIGEIISGQETYTGQTEKNIALLNKSFRASGGLVEIDINPSIYTDIDTGAAGYVNLYLDGQCKVKKVVHFFGSVGYGHPRLSWKGVLTGNHKIEVKWYCNTGAIYINRGNIVGQEDSTSEIWVTETII